jgi:hypothetical protein
MRLLAALSASFRFLHSAVPPERPGFAPWDEGRIIPGLGLGERSPDRDSSAETARSPKVPGEPDVHMPWSTTPADLSVLPFGRLDVAFHASDGVGSAVRRFRG